MELTQKEFASLGGKSHSKEYMKELSIKGVLARKRKKSKLDKSAIHKPNNK